MIDWAIIGGTLLIVAFIVWLAVRRSRHGAEVDEWATVPDPTNAPPPPLSQIIPIPPGASPEEIARRVHDYDRECERCERADATMAAVKAGRRPSNEDIALLYAYYDHDSVQQAMVGGMWFSIAEALNEVTCELRALQAMQPSPSIAVTEQHVVTLEKIG